ncbi:hypothetical protein [Streptomyces sp. NPDC054783]
MATNRTDGADTPDHIPLRHLPAFTAPVILHVTLWARACTGPDDW